LIAALKKRTDGNSNEVLQYRLKHHEVYKVRQALSEKGVQCAEPVAHPAYAIFLEKSIGKLKRFGCGW